MLSKPSFLLTLVLLPLIAFTQAIHTQRDNLSVQIKDYAVLQDTGYSLERIRADASLPFITGDSLRPRAGSRYWIRLIIADPFPDAGPYQVQLSPGLDNTLYYYDANARAWVSHRAGVMTETGNDGRIRRDVLPCILRGLTTDTLYIRSEIRAPGPFNQTFRPEITVEKETVGNRKEQIVFVTWILSISVLCLFFLINVIIYFSLRERVILYYLMAQLSGMIFITAYKQAFPVLFPCKVFSIGLYKGTLVWYDLNNLLMHVGMLGIIYGLVQFTRSYLNTRQSLPRLDALFRYGLITWLPFSLVLTIVSTRIYIETYALLYDNVFTLSFFAAIMYAGVAGHIRKLPGASAFLLANISSFVFMLATPLYYLIVDVNTNSLVRTLLPDLAILTQAITFSVALVSRTRSIRNDLTLIELENQKITTEMLREKSRNEVLQERLEINQRELASSSLYIVQKNELLATLQAQIKELHRLYPEKNARELQEIRSALQNQVYLDAEWGKFKVHFEQVHPDFFEEWQTRHPGLTKNELRLLAYFHINLSTKEIAALLNIDPASVRRAKTRLYKKMK